MVTPQFSEANILSVAVPSIGGSTCPLAGLRGLGLVGGERLWEVVEVKVVKHGTVMTRQGNGGVGGRPEVMLGYWMDA